MYNAPYQFEPLLPGYTRLDPLLSQAHDLALAATALSSTQVPPELRILLRSMNSYYTNRIEGQHTRPHEIEQALRKDFSSDVKLAARQRLALAHIAAEEHLEQRYRTVEDSATLYSPQAIQELHHELFSRLPETDLNPAEGQAIVPGNWREREVQVGRHVAPTHTSLSAFMDRWSSFYGSIRRSDAALVAVAAAHQRLGWIHPFIDGNGRVMRLHTHLWLHAMGYTGGLWSPLRGFARNAERYYALLAAADEHRHGDLDGRGNLSEKALVAWIQYVLETCRDQVDFMQQLLDLTTMKSRLEACLIFESVVRKSGIRPEALRAMHYLYLSGENLSRGEFKGMLGLGDRSATDVLSALLRRGLLKSDTPQGKVRFGLPQHALRFLFPRLWPEAETDAEEMQSSD
jgi:Fic family protein